MKINILLSTRIALNGGGVRIKKRCLFSQSTSTLFVVKKKEREKERTRDKREKSDDVVGGASSEE